MDQLFIDEDHTGHDQRLRLRARWRQPALDEQSVDALAFHRRTSYQKPDRNRGPARAARVGWSIGRALDPPATAGGCGH